MSSSSLFFDVPPEYAEYDRATVAILPVPFERTTSYGAGAAGGPAAILAASAQVELYDEMSGTEPFREGISTLPACVPAATDLGEAIGEIEEEAHRHLQAGKFLVTLGGEHSLTIGPIRAARRVHGEIGVVQLDAHADLRDTYEGTPHSHACVMRRAHEDGISTLHVGIRAFCAEEAELIAARGLPVVYGWELDDFDGTSRFEGLVERLPPKVYVTFDVDFLDPSILPATGTPVPGGGLWYPTLRLLRTIFAARDVVAMDVVELAPMTSHHASDFLVASLIYRCLGYRSR
jgi:agmatinase